mmetsp:Transcript_21334/g.32879  ORF Transcript_21334/g.32879 Transcript_21334/m.32879 type:complete len:428 (+) Transcript_21334:98-1381(+)|eukprot:CAMPEP_0195283734 /NCGR_PEP_ID=MMETSP0707-20130614/2182_1 /TAXON_ID=33640 /ORGANISM="Asterionellopsis glacialis, Strain CCMP134" /LENGTH=427 /DNA_ID=CAMNT_0040342959 /DNA_START=38 /DNA_END=1321 /DNA_ORIENTATION=+
MTIAQLLHIVSSTALLLQCTTALSADGVEVDRQQNGGIRGNRQRGRALVTESKGIHFSPFEIELFPMLESESDMVLDELHLLTTDVLETRFKNQMLPQGVSFVSIELARLYEDSEDSTLPDSFGRDRDRVYKPGDFRNRALTPPMRAASTIYFKGGTAFFTASPEAELPTSGDVMSLVGSAINEDFSAVLKAMEDYKSIESVYFTQLPDSFVPSDAPSPSPEEITPEIIGMPQNVPQTPQNVPDLSPSEPSNPTDSLLDSGATAKVNDSSNLAPIVSSVVGSVAVLGIAVLLFIGYRRRSPYVKMQDLGLQKPKLQRAATTSTNLSDYGDDTEPPQSESDFSLDGSATNQTVGTSRSPSYEEDPPLTLLVSCTLSSPSTDAANDSDILFESSDGQQEAVRISQPTLTPPYARSRRESSQIVLDEISL